MSGDIELVGESAVGELLSARERMWTALSDSAREQFFWVGQPGAAISNDDVALAGASTSVSAISSVTAKNNGDSASPSPPQSHGVLPSPPPNFLLMLLWPRQVKYLRLTDNFAQVDYFEDGQWKSQRVNP